MDSQHSIKIAFGPEALGFGSWEWVGRELIEELGAERAVAFRDEVPECDVVVFVKFKPSVEELRRIHGRSLLVFCPVDIFGSVAEIDGDWESLSEFDCIISHASALVKYFSAYARTEVMDHHVQFVSSLPTERKTSGPILWTGNAANLPPLVEWVNSHSLPEELWVLTNLERESMTPVELGFNNRNSVRIANWSPELHREWAATARGAIDIKGNDFRSRHKPPTKAYDFIASGLPLSMNLESSPAVDVADRGLQVVDPTDVDQWFSEEYWSATQALGRQLNMELTRTNIAKRFLAIIGSLQNR